MFVPDEIWVIANFKETQLDAMRPGQPVDAPDRCLSRTHASRAMSPASSPDPARPSRCCRRENATGNYVKIVQRVPVKIVIDNPPTDVALGPGMSVVPTVRIDPAPSLYERLWAAVSAAGIAKRWARARPARRQSMADRRPGRGRRLHGGARHHHRQRRAALYRRRPGGERGRGVLGRDHLSGRQRHRPDGQQLSSRGCSAASASS